MIQERKLIVPEEYSGERLDKIVSKLVPEISRSQLKKSLKKLMSLPGSVKVYPGHGDFTTISRERENNMFVG